MALAGALSMGAVQSLAFLDLSTWPLSSRAAGDLKNVLTKRIGTRLVL
jgi:hypothetical protein